MKTITTLIIALAVASGLSAQTIKMSKNEVDEFTGDIRLSTKEYMLGKDHGWGAKASISKINDTWFLRLSCTQASIYTVMEGAELILMHDDGSQTKLFANSTEVATPVRVGSSIYWTTDVGYTVSEKQIDILFKKPLSKFRQNSRDSYFDYECKGESQKSLIAREIAAVLQAQNEGSKK